MHSGRQKDQALRTCDERGQQVWGEEIDCKRVFESVDRLTTRGVRTKDPRVVDDGLERSGGVGLIRESTRLFEAGEITHQRRTMEAADALYGITMRGDGVSAVISQHLATRQPA